MHTAVPLLTALRRKGHRLALDDFGTGYSSLWALRSLPVDVLKLDRSFVSTLGTPAAQAVIGGTISMGHALGLRVIAEGVERSEQLEAFRVLGCDEVQGFLLHRPAPGPEVTTALRDLAGTAALSQP